MKITREGLNIYENQTLEIKKRVNKLIQDETGLAVVSFKRLNIYSSDNLITVIAMLSNDETVYKRYLIDQIIDSDVSISKMEDKKKSTIIGMIVTLKPNVKTVTGESIPASALGLKYVVVRASEDFVTIDDGEGGTYTVKESDLTIIN